VIALTDYFPWRRAINSVFAVVVGTIIINLQFFELKELILELSINIILVILFFLMLEPLYVKENKK